MLAGADLSFSSRHTRQVMKAFQTLNRTFVVRRNAGDAVHMRMLLEGPEPMYIAQR
jgi:hypothetical protein